MKKLLLLSAFFLTLTISVSFAQTLIIGKSSIGFSKTIAADTQQISIEVIYKGDTLKNTEYLHINFRVKNSSKDSFPVQLSDSLTEPTINPNDSFRISNAVVINNSQFFKGNDIVVIWPTGSGGIAITGDSIIDTSTIDTTAAIASLINPSFNIALYPNPTENLLYLNYNESAINLEQVRIYDLLGRTMLTKTSLFNSIDITALPCGLYFLKAITKDNNRFITQFIKSQ